MLTISNIHGELIFNLNTRRFDIKNSLEFEHKLRSFNIRTAETVLINMDGVSFVDSTGFSVLLRIQETIRKKGKKFYIINVSDEVTELIRLLKLNLVLSHTKEDRPEIAINLK